MLLTDRQKRSNEATANEIRQSIVEMLVRVARRGRSRRGMRYLICMFRVHANKQGIDSATIG
jgi:hypothetical protein